MNRSNEFSNKEIKLLTYFIESDLLNHLTPPEIYRICVSEAFIKGESENCYTKSLRRCIIAFQQSNIFRLTKEWDDLIQLDEISFSHKQEIIQYGILWVSKNVLLAYDSYEISEEEIDCCFQLQENLIVSNSTTWLVDEENFAQDAISNNYRYQEGCYFCPRREKIAHISREDLKVVKIIEKIEVLDA